jgi:hypothetical protein
MDAKKSSAQNTGSNHLMHFAGRLPREKIEGEKTRRSKKVSGQNATGNFSPEN